MTSQKRKPKHDASPESGALTTTCAELNARCSLLLRDPSALIQSVLHGGLKAAMISSFGIQSAVLLHMVTRLQPDIPVVWVDTGYLPKETYTYVRTLTAALNLNLFPVSNQQWTPARMEEAYGKLWEKDDEESHLLYGQIRKVIPLKRGLAALRHPPTVFFSGARATQTACRAGLDPVTIWDQRLKVLPLLTMTDADIVAYFEKHDLPAHPLQARGYGTVGDAHSSRPSNCDETRSSRFGGKFTECGLHSNPKSKS